MKTFLRGFAFFVCAAIALGTIIALEDHFRPVRSAVAQPAQQLGQAQVYFAFTLKARSPDISATTTSGTTKVALGAAAQVAWVCNVGAVFVYVQLGGDTMTVTAANGIPIAPNSCVRLNATGATHAAGITASSTATVTIALGTGSP